jgi:hypothetical protein
VGLSEPPTPTTAIGRSCLAIDDDRFRRQIHVGAHFATSKNVPSFDRFLPALLPLWAAAFVAGFVMMACR